MTGEARPRGRWRPALLSGLVFPGLGQLVAGHPWRALFFSGSSLALLVAVVRRVMRETQRLLPHEPEALLDPALPFRLVVEIHRANASFFFWATLGIVALWAGSIVEACLPRGRILRSPVGPAPKESDQSRHPSGPGRPGPEG
jgi:hypothetical protein